MVSQLAGAEMARRRQQSQAEQLQQPNTALGEGSSQIPQESYEIHQLRTQAHAALSGISELIPLARDIANLRRQAIESQFIEPQSHNEWNRSDLRHSMEHQQVLLNQQMEQNQQATMLRDNFDTINNFVIGHPVNNQTVKKALRELSEHVEGNQYSSSRSTTMPNTINFIKNNPHIRAFYESND
jgi:hypothetical protein